MRSHWAVAFATFALFCAAASAGAGQPRLTIKNQCTDDVWAVLTPGGSPTQVAALANSGAWFRQYATQENFLLLGGSAGEGNLTGSIVAGRQTLTLSSAPANTQFFVPGQIVKVVGAGANGADLITPILSVTNQDTVLNLQDAAQTTVTKNLVLYDTLQGTVLIKSKGSMSFPAIPTGGAPGANFKFFIGCPNGNNDPFNNAGCTIGAAAGDLAGINTLFEPTFGCEKGAQCAFNPADAAPQYPNCQANPTAANCGPLGQTDFFDISAVDGYTLPMKVKATGTHCSAPSKDASMLDLGSCPSEDSGTLYSTDGTQQGAIEKGIRLLTTENGNYKACAAPYKWFADATVGSPVNPDPTPASVCTGGTCNSVSYYAGAGCDATSEDTLRLACPQRSGPQQRVGPQQNGKFAIQNTSYVMDLHALGYTGYTWQYDDGLGAQSCDAGAAITVTLCPGSNKTPYQRAEWRFVAAAGECRVTKSAEKNFYDSLADCQQHNMRYVCEDLTDSDPYKVPGALWSASAVATVTGSGYTYAQWWNMKKLKCTKDFSVKIAVDPSDPTKKVATTVPVCTYYYGGDNLCPPNSGPPQ